MNFREVYSKILHKKCDRLFCDFIASTLSLVVLVELNARYKKLTFLTYFLRSLTMRITFFRMSSLPN